MQFLVSIIVLLVSYIVTFKEDFDKEKLEKIGTGAVIFLVIWLVLYFLLH